jgi:hypothetical protein
MASRYVPSCPIVQQWVVALYSRICTPRACIFAEVLTTYVPVSEFYIECIAFTNVCLPYVEIIMVCMRVSLVELPFSDSDGMDPSTRVYDIKCAWAPAAASYLIR